MPETPAEPGPPEFEDADGTGPAGPAADPSPLISYAQHGEDILLHRLFPDGHRGFYLDVGANHPALHSVTKHFYDRGWRGVNVEPLGALCELLRADRPGDVTLELALSDREGVMTLHEPAESLGMSTLNPRFAAGLRADGFSCVERTVPVTSLAILCDLYVGSRTVDFLKIDVEGHEDAVIRGGDWSRWRPRAVVVEATVAPESWEPVLLDAGYLLATSDGINRYYLRAEDADLLPRLAAPLWITDAFIRADDFEARRALEDRLRRTDEGFDAARYALWETREFLAQAEARERLLREELERLRAAEAGRGRLEARAIRLARLLSATWRRLPSPTAARGSHRRVG